MKEKALESQNDRKHLYSTVTTRLLGRRYCVKMLLSHVHRYSVILETTHRDEVALCVELHSRIIYVTSKEISINT